MKPIEVNEWVYVTAFFRSRVNIEMPIIPADEFVFRMHMDNEVSTETHLIHTTKTHSVKSRL